MAFGTQHDQVFIGIGSQLTSPFDVMNLQVVSCAAMLATPAISLAQRDPLPEVDLLPSCPLHVRLQSRRTGASRSTMARLRSY